MILAVLVTATGRVVPTGRRVAALWQQDGPADPRRSLQVHISNLWGGSTASSSSTVVMAMSCRLPRSRSIRSASRVWSTRARSNWATIPPAQRPCSGRRWVCGAVDPSVGPQRSGPRPGPPRAGHQRAPGAPVPRHPPWRDGRRRCRTPLLWNSNHRWNPGGVSRGRSGPSRGCTEAASDNLRTYGRGMPAARCGSGREGSRWTVSCATSMVCWQRPWPL